MLVSERARRVDLSAACSIVVSAVCPLAARCAPREGNAAWTSRLAAATTPRVKVRSVPASPVSGIVPPHATHQITTRSPFTRTWISHYLARTAGASVLLRARVGECADADDAAATQYRHCNRRPEGAPQTKAQCR